MAEIKPNDSAALVELKTWLNSNMESLAAFGVTMLTGNYYGSGDEGNFDNVQASTGVRPNRDYIVPQNVKDLIEQVCDEVAAEYYSDGLGGGGAVEMDCVTGSITHTSYSIYEEHDDNPDVEL